MFCTSHRILKQDKSENPIDFNSESQETNIYRGNKKRVHRDNINLSK